MFGPASALALDKNELAIGIAHGAFGSHAGIAFNSVKDGLQMLHLRWHHELVSDAFPTENCWIVCKLDLPTVLAIQVVSMVRSVAKKLPAINYAVDSIGGKGSFDKNGIYKPPKGSQGLTCASFVTEIFRACRVPLLKEETWPATDENKAWAADVIALMRRKGLSPDHIAAVEKSVNGIRIHPNEVGAAALIPHKSRPCDFATVSAIAPTVKDKLNQYCPIRPNFAVVQPVPVVFRV